MPPPPQPPAEESLTLLLDGSPLDFVKIKPGRFVMGCDSCEDALKPEHQVEITRPFQLGRTELTQKHWSAVMTGKASGTNKPKTNVSWNEAQQFLAKLNARQDGYHYRLPTEAEWEYCARAGDAGWIPKNLDDVAWTTNNSGGMMQDAGAARMSNPWGLHDMLGNASEWTGDWLDLEYYAKSPARDPKGPSTGTMRIFRGGNASMGGANASYPFRGADEPGARGPFLGLRVAREKR
jgi:formylglycine-generating enzyme required for sulfatase activity